MLAEVVAPFADAASGRGKSWGTTSIFGPRSEWTDPNSTPTLDPVIPKRKDAVLHVLAGEKRSRDPCKRRDCAGTGRPRGRPCS